MAGSAAGAARMAALLLLLLRVAGGAESSPDWDEDEDTVTVTSLVASAVLGGTASLPCDIKPSTPRDKVDMVLWFRDGVVKPIYTYDVRGRGVNESRQWSDDNAVGPRAKFYHKLLPAVLNLDAVQLNDEGIYRCRVDFKFSPTRNFQVNLTVIVPPQKLIIYDSSGNEADSVVGPYEVGNQFSLTCEVRGGKPTPTVSWYANQREVAGRLDVSAEEVVVNKLLVLQLRREHLNTTYKCLASNTNLTSALERSVLLNVYLKPVSVRLLWKPAEMVAKEDVSIGCEVEGSHPRAKVTWFESFSQFTRGRIKDGGDDSRLVVSTLTFTPEPEDHGKMLKCRGENPALVGAYLEDSFHMNVVFAPKVQLQLGSNLKAENIKEGDDVYFECKVRANPEHHKISWRHNGGLLNPNLTAGIIMSTQSLVLQRIVRDNAGNYTCRATNLQGETDSPTVNLRVQYAPICKNKDVTIIGASMEESVRVRCEVEADPPEVEFVWEFNNSGENFEVAPAKFEDGNNGTLSTLVYTPMSERDYGALTCWGRNSIGKQVAPCVYQIIPAVKPSPLSNCTAKPQLNQTLEMLEVDCVPGYDGGLKQEFRLEAYEVSSGKLRLNLTNEAAAVFRIPIGELLPTTHFYLLAYASNAKGRSEVFLIEDVMLGDPDKHHDNSVSMVPLLLLLAGCLLALAVTVVTVVLMMYRRRGTTSPVHIEPYMKQPIITPPDSRNNSMLDVTHGDHTYYTVEYTLKQVADYALNNQPDIIQSPQVDKEKRGEPQLFLPVRPDTLFAPYDIHKQGLQTNKCSLNPFSAKSWEPISYKADRNLMKEIIIANSIPGPESCV